MFLQEQREYEWFDSVCNVNFIQCKLQHFSMDIRGYAYGVSLIFGSLQLLTSDVLKKCKLSRKGSEKCIIGGVKRLRENVLLEVRRGLAKLQV